MIPAAPGFACVLACLLAADPIWPGTTPEDVAELGAADPERRAAAVARLGSQALAGAARAEAASARPDPARADVARRLAALAEDGDSPTRMAAGRVLARAGHEATLAFATARAADPRVAVRTEAFTILRDAARLPAAGRRAAERSLSDADATMRALALDVLVAHPAPESVPLVAGLLDDGNRQIRVEAARLLGLLGDPRALVPLLERVDAPDRAFRIVVVDALGRLRPAPGLGPDAALLRQLADSDQDVRVAAAVALGRLRVARAVPALRAAAAAAGPSSAPGAEARAAIRALGRIADPAAIDVLAELLREPIPDASVESALSDAGPAAVDAVTAALGDALPASAVAASRILGVIRDARAVPALAAVLADRPAVATAAAAALGRLRDPRAVPALLAALAHPRAARAPGARAACLRALAAIGDGRAAAGVAATIADADPEVRVEALRLAAAIGAGLSVNAWTSRLADPDETVRRAAVSVASLFDSGDSRVGAAAAATLIQSLAPADAAPTDAARAAIVGEALERIAARAGRAELVAALGRTPVTSRVWLLRALAARTATSPRAPASPHAPDQPLPAAAAGALVAALRAGGTGARAAADVLAVETIDPTTLAEAGALVFELAPETRARLCPALARARSPAGDAALADLVAHDPDPGVRAAAAWAARRRGAVPAIATALAAARRADVTPAAANATAATLGARDDAAVTGDPPQRAVRVRLLAPDGTPAARRWVRVRAGASAAAWTRTDEGGEAFLPDLPADGPTRLFVAESDLALSR